MSYFQVELSFLVLPPLLASYYNATPQEKVKSILSFTAEVLPPLSDWDNTRLCICLPILSLILDSDDNFDETTLCPLLTSLIEYILTRENYDSARTAASSCIYSIISKHLRDENKSFIEKIFTDTLSPLVFSKLDTLNDEMSHEEIAELQDSINLMALIGSAAVCRGGSLSQMGNEVASFLTLVACQENVESAGSIKVGFTSPLDFRDISHGNKIKISFIAGNAIGAMLSVENGSPFWRQRISHVVIPSLLSSSEAMSSIEHGRLLCTCHLVCCVPVRALGEKRLLRLATVIINGLEACVTLSRKNLYEGKVIQGLKQVLLTSLLKITDDAPQSVSFFDIPNIKVSCNDDV